VIYYYVEFLEFPKGFKEGLEDEDEEEDEDDEVDELDVVDEGDIKHNLFCKAPNEELAVFRGSGVEGFFAINFLSSKVKKGFESFTTVVRC